MPKTRTEKQAELDALTDDLREVVAVILADYRGLPVAELSRLRGQLRAKGTKLSVVKNTLTALALEATGHPAPEDLLQGPTALALVREDIPGSTRLLSQFARETKILTLKGAILGAAVVRSAQVEQLQDMPTREQSRAQIVGAITAPMASLVGVLNAPLRELVYIIQQRAEQMGAPANA